MPKSATSFKFGNSAWRARSSHGRKPLFSSPEKLEAACEEYFQWVEENPLVGVDVAKFQGEGTLVEVPRMRAMTIMGLCNFLDIGRSSWGDYSSKAGFSETCKRIEGIIRQQKIEGAAADMLNAGFIGKEIGLVDRQEVTNVEPITHIESEYVDA